MTMTENNHLALSRASVKVIQRGQHGSGAYVAAPSFAVYRFAWLRDGAFTADAMSRAGDIAGAEAFFSWCTRVLTAQSDRIDQLISRHRHGRPIESADFLPTRYTLSGEESSDGWWNFQLDGYGTWIWALAEHCRRHNRPPEDFAAGARLSARYIAEFWRRPCYDWWEEHPEEVHLSTLGALAAGLRSSLAIGVLAGGDASTAERALSQISVTLAHNARTAGRYTKWLGGDSVDASLISLATPFGVVGATSGPMAATVQAIERELAHGGVHRYPADTFYGGGEWVLLAAFLGWQYLSSGRRTDALEQLEWVAAQADRDLCLPEQVSNHLLAPDQFRPWLERWGEPACPLLWSHAMYLSLALESGVVTPAKVMD